MAWNGGVLSDETNRTEDFGRFVRNVYCRIKLNGGSANEIDF